MTAETVPFAQRLSALLAAERPAGGQAWLAKATGVEASTVSRLLKGGRVPTLETLELIATVFDMSVEDLVAGTDAAIRLRPGPDFVSRHHFQDAVQKMLEFERRANDAEALARQHEQARIDEHSRRRRAEDELAGAERANRLLRDELEEARAQIQRLQLSVRQRTRALERAVKEMNELRERVGELAKLVEAGKQTGRAAAVLAGIAAFTGVVTLASYLGNRDKDEADDGAAETGEGSHEDS